MVSIAKPRISARLDARLSARPLAEGALEKFCEAYRDPVRQLCAISPTVADLAVSFPGLLFALASGYGTPGARDRCLAALHEGKPLKDAATVLGFAWWLRRLPAEAFTTPLSTLPDSAEFNRRIVNHVPTESWKAAGWLDRVQLTRELADDDVALWMAWRSKGVPRLRDTNRLILLCAWAWFSSQSGTLGASLVRQPFESSLGLRRALDEAETWRKRAELAVALGDGIQDTWFTAGNARGYEIVPLAQLDHFLAEAESMDNCLDQFAPQVHQRRTRLFSVRKAGRSVADLEIAPHEEDPTMPMIEQLRGPGNRRAAPGVWQAVFTWLSMQPTRPLTANRATLANTRAAARRLWQPYLDHLSGQPGELALRNFLRSGEVLDPDFDGLLRTIAAAKSTPRTRKSVSSSEAS